MAPAQADSPSHSRATRARLTSNSLYSLASYGLTLPVNLLVNRFVVHRLGLATFGVWAALTTITGFGGILNLGISAPMQKYTAEYVALGRRQEVNALLATAMTIYTVVAAVFLLLASVGSGWALDHLFHAAQHDDTLRQLYFSVVAGFVVYLIFSPLYSLLFGLQRADVVARLNLGFSLVNALGTMIVLLAGLGVPGLAINWITTSCLAIVGNLVLAKRLFPPLVINPALANMNQLKTILSFSAKVQVATLTLTLNDQVDRAFITYALGTTRLGLYQLAARASTSFSSLSFALMAGVMPAISDLAAVKDTERVRQLVVRASRYLAIVDFGLCAGAASLSRPLIWLWLGPGFDQVAWTMIIILAGYTIWLPCQGLTNALNGIGRPDIRLRADLAFLLIHIPLSAFLIWRFGFFGTVAGTSFALASTRLYIYHAGPPVLGIPTRVLIRQSFLRPAVAAAIASLSVLIVQVAGAPLTVPVVLAEMTIFGILYGVPTFLFSLDDYDRVLLGTFALATPGMKLLTRSLRGRT